MLSRFFGTVPNFCPSLWRNLMKTISSALSIFVASLALVGCGSTVTTASPTASAPVAQEQPSPATTTVTQSYPISRHSVGRDSLKAANDQLRPTAFVVGQ
jgi:hypothetical protein